jgi:hypothetical protein
MASVYTNDLRLEEIGSGEQSGSWGDTTNTNLELIAEAFAFGTETITTNANTHPTTIADGASDPGRAMFLKYGGALDSACTITLGPNTVSKMWFIHNATTDNSGDSSGPFSIIIAQGNGDTTVTIPNGHVKVVYSNGGGSGAVITDAFAALSVVDLLVDDALTVNGGSIFNQTGEAAPDFRVETNDFDHMFFINGGLNNTAIGFNALPENQGAGIGILTGSGNGGVHLFREDGSFPSADESLGSFGWSGADSSGNLSTADAKITAFANENMAAGDAGTNIQFYTKADGVNQGTGPTSQMTISSTGFVGIGTTAPLTLLHITEDSGSSSADLTLERQDTSVSVNNSIGSVLWFAGEDGGEAKVGRIGIVANGNFTDSNSETYMLFENTANGAVESRETMRIRNTGDLVLANTDGTFQTDTDGTNNFRAGKNAGISISTGDFNVLLGDEAGTAVAAGIGNVAVGYKALKSENGHGTNVAVGAYALEDQDAAADAYNVAVGYNAGLNAATSLFSTYVGGQAGGLGVITGNTNTVVGYIAGYDLTSGNANVLVGGYSGTNLTTGQDNVAIGTSALDVDVDGNNSVAIGRNALGSQTGTDADMHNTAVGFEAGKGSTTGKFNTFIGSVSGGSGVTTGTHNTAVGMETLYALTSGVENNIFGYQAGSKITTGDFNVAMGHEALETEDTGSGSVAIGHRALKVQNNDALNYNVAVGYAAGLTLSTGIQNTLIGGFAGDALATNGGDNVALGFEALSGEQQASRNTAIGRGALKVQNINTNSNSYNTAVGALAGTSVSTGVGNQLFGSLAGDLITEGDYNVCVGYDVGSSVQNLTTGNKNILIGYKTSGPSTTDNAIGIGDTVTVSANDFSFGKASNVVTNDFDADANWSRSSDERLKKNITNQTLGLDFINDLRTVKYNWKPSDELDANDAQLAHLRREDEDGNIINDMNTDVLMHNFIAQEVKAALNTAGVSEFAGWKEDQFGVQQVSREMFVIPLVKAVQELSTALDAALARIAVLEG